MASTALVTIAYGVVALVDLALVVAAFRTTLTMGFLTLFVPVYAASFGNHRLATPHRRYFAIAWWAALVVFIAVVGFVG